MVPFPQNWSFVANDMRVGLACQDTYITDTYIMAAAQFAQAQPAISKISFTFGSKGFDPPDFQSVANSTGIPQELL
jgi:hypothetical protein